MPTTSRRDARAEDPAAAPRGAALGSGDGVSAAYIASVVDRFVPDAGQLQVLLGTLLGCGRLVRDVAGVRFVLELPARHARIAEWTYERLAPLVPAPVARGERIAIRSAPHPVFAALSPRLARRAELRRLLRTEALRVWALYQRLAECEAKGVCRCAAVTPPGRGRARSS